MEEIIIPKGFHVGHDQNEFTGVTVICAPKGAVGGVDVRGGAPGTRETDLLRPEKAIQKIHAVVLSGGSAYGLAASTGVMKALQERKIGHPMPGKVVPLVCSAVIYDLNDKEYHYPTEEMGYNAVQNAEKPLEFGQFGAGVGATVGKIRGLKYAEKSGIGAATVKVMGVTVTAIMVVNALGDVIEDGKIIAGARDNAGNHLDTEKCILDGNYKRLLLGTNTTIGCILTNAKLTKVQANKIASSAHGGLSRAIRPVHTDYDGDTVFCMSTNKIPVVDLTLLQVAAVNATERAIQNAVKSGTGITVQYDPSADVEEDME